MQWFAKRMESKNEAAKKHYNEANYEYIQHGKTPGLSWKNRAEKGVHVTVLKHANKELFH